MLIDSSVLIAYFYKEDSQHEKAKVLLDTLFYNGEYFYYTDFVLSEVITVLNNKIDYKAAKTITEYIQNSDQFILARTEYYVFDKAVERFVSKKTSLSVIDLTIIEEANEKNWKIATFDKNLEKEYKINLKA